MNTICNTVCKAHCCRHFTDIDTGEVIESWCSWLNPDTYLCDHYDQRPLSCRLYPDGVYVAHDVDHNPCHLIN
jgi:Fe-S-cluster containining protein